tara:strand:- start:7947 stop:8702 length:756 start_codon:yes stop_codon:yes gene_type:complete
MISVDSVYQKVLALANKEQRGYITPQEFNLFADHAQMDIFRQYFYDLNQSSRSPSNDTVYGNPTKIIEEKISMFEVFEVSAGVDNDGVVIMSNIDPLFFKLTSVKVDYEEAGIVAATEISVKETGSYRSSNSLMHSIEHYYPRYIYNSFVDPADSSLQTQIKIFPPPLNTEEVLISYVKKPKTPNWTYLMSGENALYNMGAGDHQNFQLHFSEENLLVIKILQLAGINIKDGSLVQLASQEEIKKIQQEKS